MKEINSLTATTILEPEIFEELLNDEDDIHQAQLLLTLLDQAKAVGVKAKFETMYKAHKKAHAKKQKEVNQPPEYPPYNRITEFNSSKYNDMQCGSWICNEDGISVFNDKGMEVVVCNHPLLLIQRLVSIETGKEKVKLAYKDRRKWKELIVDRRMIADATKIIPLVDYGIDVNSNNAKALTKYLTDLLNFNIDTIDTQMSTGKLGWIKGKFVPYDKEFLFDDESKFKDAYESIAEVGSEEAWLNLVRKIRKAGRFEPKISIAGSLASVLIEPLNALPFVLNIGGETGRGKTVSMMVAVSCWANPAENKYMTDCKSTVTALELNLDFLNNLPMFLDDMSQVKEKHQGDFTGLVYMLCSGKGKDRSNTNLGLNKRTTWKNIILTNYEYSLVTETMQGGAINRIIDVEILDDEVIFENVNEILETINNNYGFAGRRFLEAIEQVGMTEIKKMQKEAYDAIVAKAKEKGCEKEEKQILPMSILLTADRIATKYIFEDGQYLDFEHCVDLLKNKGEVSENERAYYYIQSEIAININKFVPSDPVSGSYKGEMWGKLENGYAYIINNAFEQICKKGNFSSKSFLPWAKKRGLLECAENRLKKQKWIGNGNNWCVCLKLPEDARNELPTYKDGFVNVKDMDQAEVPFN